MRNNPREKEYNFCPTCTTKLVRKKIDRRKLLYCPKCGFIFWNNPKPVVSAIINDDKKILLIKRAKKPLKNYWCLPGGYINYEETPEKATTREVEEETNLKVKINKVVGVYQINNDPRGMNLDIIYSVIVKNGKIKINNESSEFRYFLPNKLPKLVAYKHREAIKDWAKNNLIF